MIGIKIEFSKKLLAQYGPEVKGQLDSIVNAIPNALGGHIRDRVSVWGDLGGQNFPGYSQRDRNYYTSTRYPDSATGDPTPSGAERYLSPAEWAQKAGVKGGSYNVTGGMWDGLSAVVYTPTYVAIQFRGRSEGRNAQIKGAKGAKKSKPIKENNSLKAASIFRTHNVNILALTEDEVDKLGMATGDAAAKAVSLALPLTYTSNPPPIGVPISEMFRQRFGNPRTL